MQSAASSALGIYSQQKFSSKGSLASEPLCDGWVYFTATRVSSGIFWS